MTFSEKLITLRGGRGWSQEKLAQELGVTRQAVGRWERGSGLPDANSLMALARVFDVDAEWLLDEAAKEPEPRRVRRVKLMWYDWAAISVFGLSLLACRPLYRWDYELSYIRLIYYPGALFQLFAGCCIWFAGGWSFSALICRSAAAREGAADAFDSCSRHSCAALCCLCRLMRLVNRRDKGGASGALELVFRPRSDVHSAAPGAVPAPGRSALAVCG